MTPSGRFLRAGLGFLLVASACGDSDAKETGGEQSDAGSIVIDDNNNTTGGDNNGENTGAGECSGQGQQCMCSDGAMGFQTCMNGKLGSCTCSIDLSDAGLPPPSECLAGSTCQGTMGFIKGADGFCALAADGGAAGPGLPPTCAAKADCVAEGLPSAECVLIAFPPQIPVPPMQLCVQTCIPTM